MENQLAGLIIAVGNSVFFDAMAKFVAESTQAPFIEVIRFRADQRPAVLSSNLPLQTRILSPLAYFDEYFRADPFYRMFLAEKPSGVFGLSETKGRYPSTRYFTEFYPHTRYYGEVNGFVRCPDGSAIVVCVACDDESDSSSSLNQRLAGIWAIVDAAVTKHIELTEGNTKTRKVLDRVDLQRVRQVFGSSVLANREQEVVRHLLSGYSVAGLACKMGISHGTAKNYCKSVYRKLDIGSKGELFSLFFEAGLAFGHADEDPLASYDARPAPPKSWDRPTPGLPSAPLRHAA